jgi:hypothetical protein
MDKYIIDKDRLTLEFMEVKCKFDLLMAVYDELKYNNPFREYTIDEIKGCFYWEDPSSRIKCVEELIELGILKDSKESRPPKLFGNMNTDSIIAIANKKLSHWDT